LTKKKTIEEENELDLVYVRSVPCQQMETWRDETHQLVHITCKRDNSSVENPRQDIYFSMVQYIPEKCLVCEHYKPKEE